MGFYYGRMSAVASAVLVRCLVAQARHSLRTGLPVTALAVAAVCVVQSVNFLPINHSIMLQPHDGRSAPLQSVEEHHRVWRAWRAGQLQELLDAGGPAVTSRYLAF